MSSIVFVKSDNPKTVVGWIKQTSGGLKFQGVAEGIFNSLKRAYNADPPKDADLFKVLAAGWSNGPVKTQVKED